MHKGDLSDFWNSLLKGLQISGRTSNHHTSAGTCFPQLPWTLQEAIQTLFQVWDQNWSSAEYCFHWNEKQDWRKKKKKGFCYFCLPVFHIFLVEPIFSTIIYDYLNECLKDLLVRTKKKRNIVECFVTFLWMLNFSATGDSAGLSLMSLVHFNSVVN